MKDENSKKDDRKVKVNNACIGCGICATIAGDVFELDESGISQVKADAKLDEENMQKAQEAAEACPVGAIEIKE